LDGLFGIQYPSGDDADRCIPNKAVKVDRFKQHDSHKIYSNDDEKDLKRKQEEQGQVKTKRTNHKTIMAEEGGDSRFGCIVERA
jgi:hypothetical protein